VVLQGAVRNALYLLEPELKRREVTPQLEMPSAPVTVLAEPVALEQIIHNLLMNALQALEQIPASERRLGVTLAEADWQGVVTISDCGPGMAAELTVRIVDAEEGLALNSSYRQKNYATNVLTFDYTQAPMVTADLVLCAPVIAKEARESRKTLQAHYAHLLVHGTLHAQGWDHETGERDALEMETLEILLLAALGFDNPY